jgi:hypothetical protein
MSKNSEERRMLEAAAMETVFQSSDLTATVGSLLTAAMPADAWQKSGHEWDPDFHFHSSFPAASRRLGETESSTRNAERYEREVIRLLQSHYQNIAAFWYGSLLGGIGFSLEIQMKDEASAEALRRDMRS